MTETTRASILIVEDDPQQIRLYSRALRGYRLTCVSNGTAALEALAAKLPDLILLDHVLESGERGLDFLPRFKEAAAHVPIVVISGSLEIKQQLAALSGPKSAHFVIEKPVDIDELDATVETALNECGLRETVNALQSLERAEKIESNEPERRFTERLARQTELINRLRGSAEKPNISALAREFDVARKTIHRDLADRVKRGQIAPEVYPEWEGDAE